MSSPSTASPYVRRRKTNVYAHNFNRTNDGDHSHANDSHLDFEQGTLGWTNPQRTGHRILAVGRRHEAVQTRPGRKSDSATGLSRIRDCRPGHCAAGEHSALPHTPHRTFGSGTVDGLPGWGCGVERPCWRADFQHHLSRILWCCFVGQSVVPGSAPAGIAAAAPGGVSVPRGAKEAAEKPLCLTATALRTDSIGLSQEGSQV